jgi:hypothetical protein
MGIMDFWTEGKDVQTREALLDGSAFDDTMYRSQGRFTAEEILMRALHDGQQGRIRAETPGASDGWDNCEFRPGQPGGGSYRGGELLLSLGDSRSG